MTRYNDSDMQKSITKRAVTTVQLDRHASCSALSRCVILAQANGSKVGRLHMGQHEMHTLGIWECVLRFAHVAVAVHAVHAVQAA